MSITSARRLVVRHPLATFFIVGTAIYVAFTLPPQTRESEIWFGLPLYGVLGGLFGVGAAAFLVTAATDGRAGVADLARRSLRWRVPLRWYVFALLIVPVSATLVALALYGTEALEAPADGWLHVLGVVLAVFVLQLVLFQFAEEVGWTGFFQHRLQDRYAPLKLSAVVAFFWALWHLPDFFVDEGLGVEQLIASLVFLVIEFVVLFFARVVIVWIYTCTGQSVLLVAVWHAAFDATISQLAEEVMPASNAATFLIMSGIVVFIAVVVIVWTRGRLGQGRDEEMRPAATPA